MDSILSSANFERTFDPNEFIIFITFYFGLDFIRGVEKFFKNEES